MCEFESALIPRVSLLQGPGRDRGLHRLQHLVHQALLQRHAHSNPLSILLITNPSHAAALSLSLPPDPMSDGLTGQLTPLGLVNICC